MRVIGRIHEFGEPGVDRVRDGRDLMLNDGKHEPPFVPAHEFYIPQHPNFREQYQRMGEQTT